MPRLRYIEENEKTPHTRELIDRQRPAPRSACRQHYDA